MKEDKRFIERVKHGISGVMDLREIRWTFCPRNIDDSSIGVEGNIVKVEGESSFKKG